MQKSARSSSLGNMVVLPVKELTSSCLMASVALAGWLALLGP